MNFLVVVAHPDDEVLGAGATIHKLAKEGHKVAVCVMSMEARARTNRPDDDKLLSDSTSAMDMLGITHLIKGSFPNIEMNTVPHLRLVQFIERAIIETEADVLITHHPADTNDDHHQTALACQAAMRIFQRRDDVKPISEYWYMEIISSTEWSLNTAENRFMPNLFIEVGKEGMEQKIQALSQYQGVMRKLPHPRCEEVIMGLAAYRGAQAGLYYAEAFECVWRRVK